MYVQVTHESGVMLRELWGCRGSKGGLTDLHQRGELVCLVSDTIYVIGLVCDVCKLFAVLPFFRDNRYGVVESVMRPWFSCLFRGACGSAGWVSCAVLVA